MPTSRIRALVSFAAAMTVLLGLGACAAASSRPAADGPAPAEGRPLAIHFDNGAREYVHVYLIGHQAQRIAPRAHPG